jgi:hypothetical protein
MIPKNCNWPVAVDFRNARSRLCDMVCRAINRTRVIANCARANNTAGQTGGYDASCFSATTWSVEMKMHPARYFPIRAVSAALRGTQGWTALTQKRQVGMAREQQAEAAKLDAAIAKTSPLPVGEGKGVRVEPLGGSLKELGYGG